MHFDKEVRRIVIVGTGVIGASWAALYLARGFDVTATDPAPNAEGDLLHYVETAWKTLTTLGLSTGASPERLKFTRDMKDALSTADFVQENGPERPDFKIKLFADMDDATPPDSIIASSSSGLTMDVIQSGCKRPDRCLIGHPFNPPHIIPLVEVVGGCQDVARSNRSGHGVLCVHREEADPSAQGISRPRCQPATSGALSGSHLSRSTGCAECRGRRYCRVLWSWASVGRDGTQPAVACRRRRGGIRHYMEHLMDPLAGLMKALGNPDITGELKQTIVDGVLEEAGGRSVDQLAQEENEVLVRLLALRAGSNKSM
jgi:3-hydroxyacyl-CoA dehydrogenase, NAD binding domain